MPRPRIKESTKERLNGLVDDIERIIDKKDVTSSKYIGDNGGVSQDRIINEALKLLKRKYNNGDLNV